MDDMFIMISCWQRTCVLDSVADRLADTYRDAAVSMTITTLTNALALLLGCTSPFGSVRSFCLYAAVSICFCYLYAITFLGACMALNGRREAENKHWFTCARIAEDATPSRSIVFSMCCIGGRYDHLTEMEETEPMTHILKRIYGPFLTHKGIKACVVVIYAGYLAVSIYGCLVLKEGLDVKNLALDDSYITSFFSSQTQHFSELGPTVMVAAVQPLQYWEEAEQELLHDCISTFERLDFVRGVLAWFISFQQYVQANSLNVSSQKAFEEHLCTFLEENPTLKRDVNLTRNNSIQASRFFLETLNRGPKEDMMTGLRGAAESCPLDLLVYHPSFIYLDQYTTITGNTLQTVLIAMLAMLVISLLLMPNPLCAVCLALAICSVMAGVTGFMSLWAVSLDSISMINLVMCVGFSVDFSAHVAYAFVSGAGKDVNQRAGDALAHLGYPVLQGALSTVLGVLVLCTSSSYIFRTFFKIVFLVVTLGLMHGLVFIPVFLTLLGACSKWQ